MKWRITLPLRRAWIPAALTVTAALGLAAAAAPAGAQPGDTGTFATFLSGAQTLSVIGDDTIDGGPGKDVDQNGETVTNIP